MNRTTAVVATGAAPGAGARRPASAPRPAAQRLRLLLLLPILFAAGCISEDREKEIGDTLAKDVNAHLPLIEDPLLMAYVQGLGRRIADVSQRPHLTYRFYLVNTDVVNAFALPGGHIYLTRGLVQRAEDGAEFAGVVAHEIAHVAAGHGVRRLQRQLRTGSLVAFLYDLFLGGEPEILRERSFELANQALSAQHSRRDEKEADRLAMQYLRDVGIDPEGVVTLLETLLSDERSSARQSNRLAEMLSSHPLTSARIEEARREIESAGDESSALTSDANIDAFPVFKLLVSRWGAGYSANAPR